MKILRHDCSIVYRASPDVLSDTQIGATDGQTALHRGRTRTTTARRFTRPAPNLPSSRTTQTSTDQRNTCTLAAMCDTQHLLHNHHHGPEFILDTPVMRDFIAQVKAEIAAGGTVEEAIKRIEVPFAALMDDSDWLPAEYMADAPESGMGQGIGQWALYRAQDGSLCLFALVVPPGKSTPIHDHLAWGLIGLYQGTQDEDVYALTDHGVQMKSHNKIKRGEFFALIPPDDDIHQITTTSDVTSVSLHLLTNDTGCIWRHRFDAELGITEPFRSGYVNAECDDHTHDRDHPADHDHSHHH